MEEAPSSWPNNKRKGIVEYDHLINHVDANHEEDNSKRITSSCEEEEQEENTIIHQNDDIIMAKIQEIFGKDHVEVFPIKKKKKQRRYRSLVNIYMSTTPIHVGN